MRIKIFIGSVASLLFLFSAAASVPPDSASPAGMMRALQIRQDDIVTGAPQALEQNVRALNALGEKLRAMDVKAFEDEENLYALLGYLFNGGNRDIVENILRSLPPEVASQNIVKGALAFTYNHQKELLRNLAALETERADWPEALRLSVYLGTVPDLAKKNPRAASNWLDEVRLSAPGSLFEEAAIRRQIRIAAQLGDLDKIRLLVRNYAKRFTASPYRSNFWGEFIGALPLVEAKLSNEELDKLMALSPERVQYAGYLHIARVALINGNVDRAFYSAEKAGKLAHDLALDDSTVRLYAAASRVGSSSASAAAQVLQSIPADNLALRDRPLLDAAQTVAQGVLKPAGSEAAARPAGQDSVPGDTAAGKHKLLEMPALIDSLQKKIPPHMQKKNDTIDDFVKRAQEKLDSVDALLKEDSQ